jgi:hypothetical protein
MHVVKDAAPSILHSKVAVGVSGELKVIVGLFVGSVAGPLAVVSGSAAS